MKRFVFVFAVAALGLMFASVSAQAGSDVLTSSDVVLSKKAMDGAVVVSVSPDKAISGAGVVPDMVTNDVWPNQGEVDPGAKTPVFIRDLPEPFQEGPPPEGLVWRNDASANPSGQPFQ